MNDLSQVQAIAIAKSETTWDIKIITTHHLYIYKSCVFTQNLEGVTQKISLPCPWPFETSQGRGRLIFWATTSKFGEKTHLLMIFKWYEIMFLIPPLVSDLKKSGWAAPYIPIACTWLGVSILLLKVYSKNSHLQQNLYLLNPLTA